VKVIAVPDGVGPVSLSLSWIMRQLLNLFLCAVLCYRYRTS